jgi:hypothetical protein
VNSKFLFQPFDDFHILKDYIRHQGRIGSPNFGGIFFKGPKKKKKNCCQNKIADQKKRSLNNYKGPLKKKGEDAGGPPIALGAPKL